MSSDESGNPLFCATDVAKALGYSNPYDAIAKHCKSAGVAIREVGVQTGIKSDGSPAMQVVSLKFITEGNLYRLIARSNLQEAEKFESWIFDEVVPSVRKNGGYLHTQPEDSPEEIMAKALMLAQKTMDQQKQRIRMLQGKNQLLEKENSELAPKAQYTDEVLQSNTTYTHTQMAKELNFRSVNVFLQKCQEEGILYKQSGIWMPYSKYAGRHYMKTRTTPYSKSDGTIGSNTISVWTEEGRRFLHEKFNVALQPIEIDMFNSLDKDI